MHLLQIDHDKGRLLQGLVRTEWPSGVRVAAAKTGAWSRLFARSAQLWSQLQPLSAGLRVSLSAAKGLSTLHSFVVDAASEDRLRTVVASFLRTDRLASGRTEAPQSSDMLDGVFLHRNVDRLRLASETLSTSDGLRIAHGFRLADYLPRLLQTAADMGISVDYEMQAAPWTADRELLRAALLNSSRIAESQATPRDLAADQQALVERLRQADFQIEEAIASDSAASVSTLGEIVGNLAASSIYARHGIRPKFGRPDETANTAFGCHVHSCLVAEDEASEFEQLSSAATRTELDTILGCRSLGLEDASLRSLAGGSEPLFASLAGSAAQSTKGPFAGPTNGQGSPFLFVSYARADSDRVFPIVERLADSGVGLWIDREIPTSNDWATELETQLVRCRGVLAFVSPAYGSSKNCGREIRVADALDRPIFPIVVEPADLYGTGLAFLLNNIQRLEAGRPTIISDIMAAVSRLGMIGTHV